MSENLHSRKKSGVVGSNLITAGRHKMGCDQPCFIIAEAGVNHNGDVSIAKQMIAAAAESGVQAIKFQSFKTEKLVAPSAPCADYQLSGLEQPLTQMQLLKKLEFSTEVFRELKQESERCGLTFLCSPFEEESADMLEALGVCAFKIPSGELTNIPFLEHVAKKQRPMIISTGMSSLDEIDVAIEACLRCGNRQIVILHCVSSYPADPAQVNLRCMQTLRERYGLPVGYSDHTLGIEVALAAVALGACVIEKHFTLSRAMSGPDHAASIEPLELKNLVDGIKTVAIALGEPSKRPREGEAALIQTARKSVAAKNEIRAGERLSSNNLCLMRPGTGIQPSDMQKLFKRRARVDIARGALIELSMLSPESDKQ